MKLRSAEKKLGRPSIVPTVPNNCDVDYIYDLITELYIHICFRWTAFLPAVFSFYAVIHILSYELLQCINFVRFGICLVRY